MAFEIILLLKSGDGEAYDNPRRELLYLARGGENDTESGAVVAAYTAAPGTFEGLDKLGASVESLGGYMWHVTISYAPASVRVPQRPGPTDPARTRIETTGATRTIRTSLSTVHKAKIAGTPNADFKGLINVDENGAQGVEIVVPQWRETTTKTYTDAQVTPTFKQVIYGLNGKVNNAVYRGFQPGEVLFLGADLDQRPAEGLWDVTYRFAMNPNLTGIEIGEIEVFDAKGWEYVWTRTVETDDGAGITRKPTHAFVEQVYEPGDLSLLGV